MQGKPKRRRFWVVLFVAFGLIAGAGIASAADGDPDDDTLLNFGYDEDNHIFLVNTSPTDSTYDCALEDDTVENNTLSTEYLTADDGGVEVDMLFYENGHVVQFANRPVEDVGTDFEVAEGAAKYEGADGPCGVSAAVVAGPNGQINHGQFMKLFHELVDGQGMGCLNRVIAQSDLGKGDQQLRTTDVVDGFMPESIGEVDFTTALADCEHGKKDKGEDHPGSGNGQGKKDEDKQSGRSGSPGNSGNAPGRNK